MVPPKGEYVLVTTEFRGVFWGEVLDSSMLPNEITLSDARNCIYWSQDMEGFLGLAKYGPSDSCKIGASVKELTLYKITSVAKCSDGATEKWKNK